MKKLLIGILLVLVVLLLVGFVLPKDYKVSRSVVIAADKAKVHAYVGDLKRWDEWAPWKKADPTVVTTLGTVTNGVGASQTWTGKEGDGRLKFTRCDVESGIAYDMSFIDDGREMPAQSAMNYKGVAGGIEVEWTMQGKMDMPVIGGWFAMFADGMIGGMFNDGLTSLKAKAEGK